MTQPTVKVDASDSVSKLFAAQKAHAPTLAASTAKERSRQLLQIANYLTAHQQIVVEALKADFNKPEVETLLSELATVLSHIRHIRKHLKSWMVPKAVRTPLSMLGTDNYIHYEPKGQVLIIAPWNYPLNLSLIPAVYALAAGCTILLKPSEFTPHTTAFLRQLAQDLFPPEVFSVVAGEGELAVQLTALPFDHIFFTGSPQIGKLVMQAASKNLTSVTLELGGKSPAIFDRTAAIPKCAKALAWAKFFNAGQTCIAPDYLLVEAGKEAAVQTAVASYVQKAFGPLPEQSDSFARIINDRHFQRLQALLDDAVKKGAKVVFGGQHDASTLYFAPTLLTHVREDMQIMQEEIFGPILPMLSFQTLEEAVAIVNRRPKPLTLYINSEKHATVNYLVQHTRAGGTIVNDYLLGFANPYLPLGGVNNSGIGKSFGLHGFIEFSNERGMIHRRFLDLSFLHPPYTERLTKLVRKAYKWM